MKNKDTIILFLTLALFTGILFTTTYKPPQKTPATKITSMLSPIKIEPPTTSPTEETTVYTVTILANNTLTVPITISWGDSQILYYNSSHTFTINPTAVIYNGTTTTLPDIDVSIIEAGDLRILCDTEGETITGTDSFWPEAFLELMGYTTAHMTAVAPCKNMYLVTAS